MKSPHFLLALLAIGLPVLLTAQCNVNASWNTNPAAENGQYSPGQTVTICASSVNSTQLNGGKINGFELILPAAWDLSTINAIVLPPNCPNAPGQWVFLDSLSCAGGNFGPGFYFDGASNPATDPCANVNDGCATSGYIWSFCFEINTRSDCSTDSMLNGASLTPSVRILSQSDLSGAVSPAPCVGGLILTSNNAISLNCCEVQAGLSPEPATNCTTGSVCLIDLLEGDPTSGGVWTNQIGSVVSDCSNGPILPGNYQYTVSGISGCTSTSSVEILGNDLGLLQNLPYCGSSPIQICAGLTLANYSFCDATFYYPGYPDVIVEVPNGVIDPALDSSGVYHGVLLAANGCPTHFQVNLNLGGSIGLGSNLSVDICGDSGLFCPSSYIPGYMSVGLSSEWVVLNQNFGFISFHPTYNHCGFQNLLNLQTPTTYYFLLVTGAPPCSTFIDTLQVNVIPGLNAGPDQSFNFCAQEGEIDLFSLLPAGVPTSGTWSLEPLDIAFPDGLFDLSGYAADGPVQMTYSLNDGPCIDQAVYSLHIQGETIVLQQLNVCTGASPISLFSLFPQAITNSGGMFTGPTGPWTAENFDPAIDPAGVYSYLYIGSCGFVSVQLAIAVVQDVSAGPDLTALFCEQAGVLDLNSLLNPSNGAGNQWIGGALVNYSPQNSGDYYYVASGVGCEPDTAVLNLTIVPALQAQNVVTTCNSLNTYTLSFQIYGGFPPYIVNGVLVIGNTFSQTLPVGTPYIFTIDDNTICSSINLSGLSPSCPCNVNASFAETDTLFCAAQLINVPVWLYGQAPFSLTYAIDGISTMVSGITSTFFQIPLNLETTSTVTLIAVSDAFCTENLGEEATFSVSANPPIIDLGLVQSVVYCSVAPVSLSSFLSPQNAISTNSTWYYPNSGIVPGGIFNPSVDPDGAYTSLFANDMGCPTSLVLEVHTNGGVAQNASVSTCAGDNFCPFEAFDAANPDIELYAGGQWILYNENFNFLSFTQDWDDCSWMPLDLVADTTAFYFVYVIGSPPCAPVIDTLTVTVFPSVENMISSQVNLCEATTTFDLNTLLPAGITGGMGWNTWDTIALNAGAAGTYQYAAQSGCNLNIYSFDIAINPQLTAENTNVLCLTDPTTFQITLDIAGGVAPFESNLAGSFDGASFSSEPLMVGTTAVVSISDAGNCPVLTLEFSANDTDGDGVCDEGEIVGCQNPNALNYNPLATDPGICLFEFSPAPPVLSENEEPFTGVFIGAQDSDELRFQLSPNPARLGSLVLVHFNEQPASSSRIQIFDMNGQLVFDKNYAEQKGQQVHIQIDNQWSSGIYVVVASSGQTVERQNLILVN